jgi:hypothetical protein
MRPLRTYLKGLKTPTLRAALSHSCIEPNEGERRCVANREPFTVLHGTRTTDTKHIQYADEKWAAIIKSIRS